MLAPCCPRVCVSCTACNTAPCKCHGSRLQPYLGFFTSISSLLLGSLQIPASLDQLHAIAVSLGLALTHSFLPLLLCLCECLLGFLGFSICSCLGFPQALAALSALLLHSLQAQCCYHSSSACSRYGLWQLVKHVRQPALEQGKL